MVSVPPAMPDVDLTEGDLVGHVDRGLQAGAACLLDVCGRCHRRQLGPEDRFPGQVEVAGVLEDGAGDNLADDLTLESEPGDQAVDRGGQHVLVGGRRVDGVGAGERDSVAPDDGNPTGLGFHAAIFPAAGRPEKDMRGTSRNVDSELHLLLHVPMTDRYQSFTSSPIGKLLVKNLGLPSPMRLERYTAGAPLVDGLVLTGGQGRLAESLPGLLDLLGVANAQSAADETTYKGLVFDATGLTSSEQLHGLRDFFTPLLRSLAKCPRVVVLGTPPEQVTGAERVAQRALEGFTRSLGKEIGKGGTVQLVYVADGAEAAVTSTLAFLLSPKSAYVSGQVIRIGAHGTTKAAEVTDWMQPLAGKVALVTGASRGIGEQIARVLHRDGATIVGVDVPQAADELITLMKELGGDHLTLDITAKDAAATHRPPPGDQARGRRRRRPQRRHHARQEARQHARRPLGLRHRRQPDRARANHPRAARPEGHQRERLDRRRRLHRRYRRQCGPDQLRRLQGRRDRVRRLTGRRAARTASPSTR